MSDQVREDTTTGRFSGIYVVAAYLAFVSWPNFYAASHQIPLNLAFGWDTGV